MVIYNVTAVGTAIPFTNIEKAVEYLFSLNIDTAHITVWEGVSSGKIDNLELISIITCFKSGDILRMNDTYNSVTILKSNCSLLPPFVKAIFNVL